MTSYTTVVGKTTDAFCIQTFLDSFVLMSGDYEVVLSKNPFLLEATNTSRNLRYVLPMSPDSTFEG